MATSPKELTDISSAITEVCKTLSKMDKSRIERDLRILETEMSEDNFSVRRHQPPVLVVSK